MEKIAALLAEMKLNFILLFIMLLLLFQLSNCFSTKKVSKSSDGISSKMLRKTLKSREKRQLWKEIKTNLSHPSRFRANLNSFQVSLILAGPTNLFDGILKDPPNQAYPISASKKTTIKKTYLKNTIKTA